MKRKVKRAFTYATDEDGIISRRRKKAVPVKCKGGPEKVKPPRWNDETEELWEAKRNAMEAYQADLGNEQLKEDERNASRAFKKAAQEAKDNSYEEFCINVNDDRSLFLL